MQGELVRTGSFNLSDLPQDVKLTQRCRVVRELYTTEKSYGESLQLLHEVYYVPLLKNVKGPPMERIISRADLNLIFSNLEFIVAVNKELLTRIQERIVLWSEDQLIADIFLHMGDFLKVYKNYCSTFDDANDKIGVLLRERPLLADFLANADRKARERMETSSNIYSFLIMPVQRIPRYGLLLKELLQLTNPSHPDYANIEEAAIKCKAIASSLNESVAIEEHRQIMIKIQNRFVLNYLGLSSRSIVAPHRRYIREGILLLENTASVPGKFYAYLFNDVFVTARILSRHHYLRTYQELDDMVPLHHMWVIEETTNDRAYLWRTADNCCFGLLTPNANYFFRCTSPQERAQWTYAIGEAIFQYLELRPSYLSHRATSFPMWSRGRWRFRELESPSLSAQMAKHIFIRNDPPPVLKECTHS